MFFANEVRLQLLQRCDGGPALIIQRVHLLVVLKLGTGRGDERMNIDHTLEVQQGFLAVLGDVQPQAVGQVFAALTCCLLIDVHPSPSKNPAAQPMAISF